MNRVDGRIAIVTGAAGGIGSETARLMARAGATVIATDLRQDDGQALVAAITAEGGKAEFHRLDVTREEQWEGLLADVLARHGRLDVMVNNAGIYRHGRIEDARMEDMAALFGVNLKGVVLMCDPRRGMTELDEILLDVIRPRVEDGMKFLILLTKSDKLNKTEGAKALQIARLNAAGGDVKLFSALKKQGVEEVAQHLWDWTHPDISSEAKKLPDQAANAASVQ